MIDYIVKYSFWADDIEITKDRIITVDEDINIEDDFERDETVRSVLTEKLKEEYGEGLEILEFEELTDRDCDIYKLTY